jgi:hypothetical protein
LAGAIAAAVLFRWLVPGDPVSLESSAEPEAKLELVK